MKKKLFFSTLCFVLLLVMMLSTTLAWFTDSTSATNTMVAGKISIEQTETDEEGQPFVGSDFVMMPNVPIVKKVTVENTGNQDCYLRTLFAFEDDASGMVLSMLETTGKTIVIPGVSNQEEKVRFTVTKNGETVLYTVGYYIHLAALPYEDNAQTNLVDDVIVLESVKLKGEAQNAWHEAVKTHYDLLVLSQATQVAGMETFGGAAEALREAFAPITSENCAQWFDTVINDAEDVVAAYSAP